MIRHRARRILLRCCLAAVAAIAGAVSVATTGPRFYADDPISREPETQDASAAQPVDVGLLYDFTYNLFVTPGKPSSNVHAKNVNTIDEVPDSGWFTNRILPRQLSNDDLLRGPHTGTPPNPERWVIVREKSGGFAPGFTAVDANGATWFVSFDPPSNPEGATGAMLVANKIFWALGYNQIETYITTVDPRRVTFDKAATFRRPNGKRTPADRSDLEAIFERAARNPDGTYRAAAGRLLPGKVLGPFKYEGTRPDDPNDVVEHQHRRELRALRVFGAWTNLTDLKAGNTLDTLVAEGGRSVVRHYLQDVGSTFGIGANGPHDWDEGFEYFYEGTKTLQRMLTFGFALSPWQTANYTLYPSIGRFEADAFDPVTWKPHAATTAYIEMLADDAFWAARRVAAFDDELIRSMVAAGEFSDRAAADHLARVLIARRDKIARAYLPAVNPIVNARLSAGGELTFDNAAVDARVAEAPSRYRATWSRFDNATGSAAQPLGESSSATPSLNAPRELPTDTGAMVQVDVAAQSTATASWNQPVRLHFRRVSDGWALVGLDRGIGRPETESRPAGRTTR